ncbi:Crp/Fnr family transcriptional regulator [Mycoplana ramosa]|uniref:Crp/Fnr family transcriptional regulator n=1 Tax=Mycoplana ramosa TaxID=40837 RepID=A0ABW3YTE6_MYCRA
MAESGNSPAFLSNNVLAALGADARNFIADHSEMREMNTGDVIFANGARVTHLVFPVEGVVSFIAELAGDKCVEKVSIGREGFLGFARIMESDTSLGTSVVQVPGRALWLPTSDFDQALLRFSGVRETMLRYAKSLMMQLMESVACSCLHTAEQRVSRWLLQAHDRVSGDEFQVTQEAISRLLALRRATVNAACSELMNAGAITYNRGRITVRDRKILHDRCCPCYDRIRSATAS